MKCVDGVKWWLSTLVCLAGALMLTPCSVFSQEMAIKAERLMADETLRLDGSLTHPAWSRATVHSDFTEKEPRAGVRSRYETRVRVLFNNHAIYIGVEALDPMPDEIRAPVMRRDNVFRTQDFVAVYIDTAGAKRSAQVFKANAAGNVADGIYTAADDTEDLAPDFDFDAVSQRSDAGGYTTVFRIPFASLRYSSSALRAWRIMVTRRVPREQFHLLASVPLPADAANLLVALQPLQGVELPKESWFLSLRPSVTAHANRKRRENTPSETDIEEERSTRRVFSLIYSWRQSAGTMLYVGATTSRSESIAITRRAEGFVKFQVDFDEIRTMVRM